MSESSVWRHAPSQAHGRIDGPIPQNKARCMNLVRIPKVELKKEEGHRAVGIGEAGEQTGRKVDEVLRGMVRAWLAANGGFRGATFFDP